MPAMANEGGEPIERRLDDFAELTKEGTQLAGKIRLNLNSLSEKSRVGNMSTAPAQLNRLSESLTELLSVVDRLGVAEPGLGLRGQSSSVSQLAREVQAQLNKRGVAVMKGPEPYWLAYPAWYKIERNSKGTLEVILNGDKLESTRPSVVADQVAEAVSDKLNTKQLADLIQNVRQLLRRAGAAGSTLMLEDMYEVLALEPGKGASRRKDFSKGNFFYSVHRLAEEVDRAPRSLLTFPPANRSDIIFFNKHGESRKYLTVAFEGMGPS